MKSCLRVLLVEDNAGDADLVKEYLAEARQAAFEVECVPRLAPAISLLKKEQFDVVLLDLGLPDSSGLQTLAFILELAHGSPTVVLTGLDDEITGLDAVRLGAQDYLLKGHFAPDLLIRTILYSVERKRMHEDLQKSEESHRITLMSIADGVIVTDVDGRVVRMNPVAERLTGWPEREAKGKVIDEVFRIVNEESREAVENPVQRVLREGTVVGLANHTLLIAKDGTERPIGDSGAPILDENGAISGVVLILRDQTEEREAQKALKQQYEQLEKSERRAALLADLVERSSLALAVGYPDGRFGTVNDAFCELTGYSKDELSDVDWATDLTPPEWRELTRSKLEELNRTGQPARYEKEYIRKDGSRVPIELLVHLVKDECGAPQYYYAFVNDIAERKKAEETLRASEDSQRLLFDHMLEGFAHCKMLFESDRPQDFVYLHVNEAFERLTGLKNVIGRKATEVIPGIRGSNPELFEIYGRVCSTGIPEKFEIYLGPLGRWFSISAYRTSRGEHFIAVFDNISQRKKAEAELERLMAAIEQAGEIVFITDSEGTIQYVNPAFETVTGYTREEAVGQDPSILKSGEHDDQFYRQLWDTIKAGKTWSGRITNKKKNGQLYQEETTISPVRDASGQIVNFVAVKRDITEHLELSKQLFQAQKMEAVGTLAGGVAHDFNNILQVVLGYSELLLSEEQLPKKFTEDLSKMNLAARNGADLVHRLLTFSRKTEIKPLHLTLNGRIEQLQKMLSRTISRMIDVELVLADNLWSINADPTQVDQVLMNLAVNARDAMPEGGKLVIETKNVILDEDDARSRLGAKPGSYVLLSVSDTGQGMDKETVQHIFEPFFTTKGPGEGTGLGLATVYGIVRHHDGYIACHSEPGLGTSFRLYFPAVVSDDHPTETAPRPLPQGGPETILLVDDEEFIRDLGSRILTKAGYDVIAASNGKEAVAIYKSQGERISLVILDLIMPEMDGRGCLKGLLEINPNIKVLIASGISAYGPSSEAVRAESKGFVNKPYDMRQMLQIVRDVLDRE